jgi:hypothetical protein
MTTSKEIFVSMTDKFMSGWGKATNKINKYIIICENWEQAEIIERNAKKRSEMKYINICLKKPNYNSKQYYISWNKFSEMGDIWTK